MENIFGHIDFGEIDKVTQRDEYYKIKTILNKYYNSINYLNADIEQLGIVDVENETQKKQIIEQYTKEGIKILQEILDKECIDYLNLNEENIESRFVQYKNYNFTIKDMYTVEKNINTSLYYINGLLDDLKEYKVIVKTDSYTQTFSIYSQEYIENKEYDETSIEKEFNISKVEYIEKNDNNQYTENNITDEIMAQYYLYDYGNTVQRNIEKAYELLEEQYRKQKYPTIENYKQYIKSSDKNYALLELKNYSMKQYNDYVQFICKDQYGDTYIFNDTGIMNYKLKLDDYTIVNDEYIEEYNKLENKKKVKTNITKFFNMINMGDYELAYGLLEEKFRQNNFDTVDKFKEHIQTKMFKHNKVKFNAYSSQMAPLYIYKVTLKDITNDSKEEYEYKILVKLLEEGKFVMSFAQE